MTDNKIFLGLYEKALPDSLEWDKRLNLAKKAGFSFMEISIDESDKRLERLKWDKVKIQKLRQMVAEAEIPLLTMCLSANRRFPIASSHPMIQKKGMEIIQDAIYFASHLGIRIVQIAGYDVLMEEEKSTKESRLQFGTNLSKVVNLASKLGVTLAVENVDVDFGNSIGNLIYYVNSINSPWLHLYPDIGNLAAMNQDVPKQLLIGKSHIVAVHIKDTREGIVRRVPYGEGIVDFVSAFKMLKRINFNGPLLLEMWADNDDNFKTIKRAREWVLEKANKVWV